MRGVTKREVENPSDEYAELITAAAQGNTQALEHLLMKAQEVAYRFSRSVCGGPLDAEDVMQDALLKTFRYVNRIRNPHAFRTWLYRTVRNACLMKRRRRAGEPDRVLALDELLPAADRHSRAMPRRVERDAIPNRSRPIGRCVADCSKRCMHCQPTTARSCFSEKWKGSRREKSHRC
jgi:DNA-directed RNA polymerase specialized sigma24 family protein